MSQPNFTSIPISIIGDGGAGLDISWVEMGGILHQKYTWYDDMYLVKTFNIKVHICVKPTTTGEVPGKS